MIDFKYSLAMKVTAKQYRDELESKLIKLGYKWDSFNTPEEDLEFGYPYLITDYWRECLVGSIGGEDLDEAEGSEIFIEHYKPELFLAIAAMMEGDDWIVGEWLVYFKTDSGKPNFKIFECKSLIGANSSKGLASNKNKHLYRKATLNEIKNHINQKK